MHRSPSHRITSRRAVRPLASLLAAGALLGSAAQAQATPVPLLVPGNPTCAGISNGAWTEVKIDPVGPGVHKFVDDYISGVVTVNAGNKVFNWTANKGVDAVIAKGGPMANVYISNPEETKGNGLHAPLNLKNLQYYGLSHISICYDKGEDSHEAPPGDPQQPTNPNNPTNPTNPPSTTPPAPGTPGGTPTTQPRLTPTGTPIPQGGVLPTRTVSGRSALVGPSGCMAKKATATVTGRKIKSVTFSLDGKRVKKLSAAPGRKRFTLALTRKDLKPGLHRLAARVVYTKKSATRPRTHRIAFQRCAKAAVAPKFAG
jgi:hypothetical protein